MDTQIVISGAELWRNFLQQIEPSVVLVGPLAKAPPINKTPAIFVDGGAQWFRPPGITVGDGDSWEKTPQVQLRPDKDVSDLAFVLRSLPSQVRLVEMLGFLGGARDQEWFNLGEVDHFLAEKTGRVAHLDQQILGFSRGHWHFEHEGPFSFFTLRPAVIELDGEIEFSVTSPTALRALDSRGLSNRASGWVRVKSSEPAFVIFKDPDLPISW